MANVIISLGKGRRPVPLRNASLVAIGGTVVFLNCGSGHKGPCLRLQVTPGHRTKRESSRLGETLKVNQPEPEV